MYQDTNRIRQTRVGINLDAYEAKLIDAYVAYVGITRAECIRQLAMNAARATLANATMAAEPRQSEGLERAL